MARTQIFPTLVPATQNTTNILINGGMEVWQRGTSFSTPASGAYTADRWKTQVTGGPTYSVARDTGNVDNGTYSAKLDITVTAASPGVALRQSMESVVFYNGKPLTLTARVKCNVANKCIIALADDNGIVASSSNVGTGFETLTVTISSVTATSSLNVYLGPVNGGGITPAVSTMYFDSVMLVIGTVPAPFTPTDPEVEFAQCQRYFQVLGTTDINAMLACGQNEATTIGRVPYTFPVAMRTAPTITVNNPTNFGVTAAGGASVAVTAMTSNAADATHATLKPLVASGLVAGNAGNLVVSNTNATVYFSAEI